MHMNVIRVGQGFRWKRLERNKVEIAKQKCLVDNYQQKLKYSLILDWIGYLELAQIYHKTLVTHVTSTDH